MADMDRGERLQIMLTAEELSALDDWRFGARIPSRAAACARAVETRPGGGGLRPRRRRNRSRDFGVITGDSSSNGATG